MRNYMLLLIFLVLLFNIAIGGQFKMEIELKDTILMANPDQERLIKLEMKDNDNINNEVNFEIKLNDTILSKICETEDEECQIEKKIDSKDTILMANPDQEELIALEMKANENINNEEDFEIQLNDTILSKICETEDEERAELSKPRAMISIDGYTTIFIGNGLEKKRKELIKKEENILKNYCKHVNRSNKRWCEWEARTVNVIKSIYGDNIRIVQERNKRLAPEFDFFSQPKQEMELHLSNLADVSDSAYTFEEFINLDKSSRKKIEDNLKQKIADAHGCTEDEVRITSYSKGSTKVAYETPAKSNINYNNLSANMKRKFNQYESMEVHTAFFRPEFDINMFDTAGHKDFKYEGRNFKNIGGLDYTQPQGWIRMGLNVQAKYNSITPWLQPFGERQPGLWARGYHGPSNSGDDGLDTASKIAKSKFKIGPGDGYGPGIYWSDDPNFCNGAYDGNTTYHGKTYAVKLQVAVRPGSYSDNQNGNFHCPNPNDIRLYGILIKQL